VIPGWMDCNSINGDISDGISKKMEERLNGLEGNAAVQNQIADALNTSAPLGLTDLANGPISSTNVTLPAGGGFSIGNAKYVQTAPSGHLGGSVWIWNQGIDAAASFAVKDLGGTRFPYSFQPATGCSVVTETHERTRPRPPSITDSILANSCQGLTVSTQAQPVAAASPTTSVKTAPAATGATKAVSAAASATNVHAKAKINANAAAGATVNAARAPAATKTAPANPTVVAQAPVGSIATVPATTGPRSTTTTAPNTVSPIVVQAAAGRVAVAGAAPISATTKLNAINVANICCLTQFGSTIPTDFDLGVIVNGATVNQLSRALTAGAGDGSGVLDYNGLDDSGNLIRFRAG